MPTMQPKLLKYQWKRSARERTLSALLASLRPFVVDHEGAWDERPDDYRPGCDESTLHLKLLILSGKADGLTAKPACERAACLARAAAILLLDGLRRVPRKRVLGEDGEAPAIVDTRKDSWLATEAAIDALAEWRRDSEQVIREEGALFAASTPLGHRRGPEFIESINAAFEASTAVNAAVIALERWLEVQRRWYGRHGGDDWSLTKKTKGSKWLVGEVVWTLRGSGAATPPFTYAECATLVDDGDGGEGPARTKRCEAAARAWAKLLKSDVNPR